MTKDEAIYLLRNTAWLAPSGTLESVEEAVKMATEALEHTETHDLRTDTHDVCSDELISRQDTIDAIEHVTWYHQNRSGQMVSGANSDEHQAWYKAEDVYEAIEAVPTANKSGHWIDTGYSEEWYAREYICSECGDTMLGKVDFCPHCGADMKGGENETD